MKTIKPYRTSCKAAQQSLGISNSIQGAFWTAFILTAVLLHFGFTERGRSQMLNANQ
jgi:hypothetical protein